MYAKVGKAGRLMHHVEGSVVTHHAVESRREVSKVLSVC
jgi:hypothetical protein